MTKTLHPFAAREGVTCVQVPDGSLPPLEPGVHFCESIEDDEVIVDLPTASNALSPEELNVMPVPDLEDTHVYRNITTDGEIDPDRLYDMVDVENLVDIPEEEVDAFQAIVDEETEALKKVLLDTGATSILSYDNAAGYTEAVLRDQFGVEAEVERGVVESVGALMNLDLVCLFAKKMQNVPEEIRNIYLTKFAEEAAAHTHEAINKKQNSQRYSDILGKLHAKVRSKQAEGADPLVDSPMGGDDPRSNLGTMRRRS